MSISVGELEMVLKARDELTPVVQNAQAQLKKFAADTPPAIGQASSAMDGLKAATDKASAATSDLARQDTVKRILGLADAHMNTTAAVEATTAATAAFGASEELVAGVTSQFIETATGANTILASMAGSAAAAATSTTALAGAEEAAAVATTEAAGAVTALEASLSLMLAAIPVIAAAWAGWKVGEKIGELTGVTKAIENWEAATGKAALTQETYGAKQDVINKAWLEGAPIAIRYGDAVKYTGAMWELTKPFLVDGYGALQDQIKAMEEAKHKAEALAEARRLFSQIPGIVQGELDLTATLKAETQAAKDAEKAARELARAQAEEKRAIDDAFASMYKHLFAMLDAVQGSKQLQVATVSLMKAFEEIGDQGIHTLAQELGTLEETYTSTAEGPLQDLIDKENEHRETLEQNTNAMQDFGSAIGEIGRSLRGLGDIGGVNIGRTLTDFGRMMDGASLENYKKQLTQLKSAWDKLGTAKQIGVGVGVGAEVLANATDNPETKSGQVVHYAAEGAAIGTKILPGWGTAIGAGVGAIVGALKVSPVELAARKSFEDFQKQFGSMDDTIHAVGAAYASLGLQGTQAEHDLRAALDATHTSAEDEQAALAVINDTLVKAAQHAQDIKDGFDNVSNALGDLGGVLPSSLLPMVEQMQKIPGLSADSTAALAALAGSAKPDFQKLIQVADKYGLSLAELGPKFQKADLDGKAKQLLDDIQPLLDQGADYGAVMAHTAKAFEEIVKESLKTGQAVPENLKPYLQSLVDSGQLVDENGEKLTDLSKIKFGDPLKSATDILTDALNHLSDILSNKLPGAATSAANDITNALGKIKAPTITIPIKYGDPGPVPVPGDPNNPGSGVRALPWGGSGLGAASSQHVHVYLDGTEVYAAMTRAQSADMRTRVLLGARLMAIPCLHVVVDSAIATSWPFGICQACGRVVLMRPCPSVGRRPSFLHQAIYK